MRVLLDEQLPLDLAFMLEGHAAATVVGRGWAGAKNGDLLRRMHGEYDALLTMDLVPSNRMVHLQPLVPAILEALPGVRPGQLLRIGG